MSVLVGINVRLRDLETIFDVSDAVMIERFARGKLYCKFLNRVREENNFKTIEIVY